MVLKSFINRISLFFLVFLFFILKTNNTYAFFTQNYKKNISYGVFKKDYTGDIYISLQAGFLVKNWTPDFNTVLISNPNKLSEYTSAIPDEMKQKTKGKYSYSLTFSLGFHNQNSNFRHEVGFTWYSLMSKPIQMSGASITIDGESYNYNVLDGKYTITAGTFLHMYKIMYSLYYDIPNAFNLFKIKWDIYFGVGGGIAIVDSGVYAGKEISVTETGSDGENNEGGGGQTYEVVDNNISNAINAKNYRLFREKSIAVAYQFSTGFIGNISQSFAMSVGLQFGATSRPLLTSSFKKVDNVSHGKAHFEYHIAIQLGILLKAFEVAF